MAKQVGDEIEIHQHLNHPNIVKLYGVFEEEDSVYLIMECVVGGSLFDYLNEREQLSAAETAKLMRGIIEGIHYMHDKSIAHRDIKPENILIAESGMPKICDMGWSAVISTSRKTYCGTFDYVAPEILERKDYGLSVDIWCLGTLTYELLCGKMPYEGDKTTIISKKITNVLSPLLRHSSSSPRGSTGRPRTSCCGWCARTLRRGPRFESCCTTSSSGEERLKIWERLHLESSR